MKWEYLLVLGLVLLFPLVLSIRMRLGLFRWWRPLVASIGVTTALFVAWDAAVTARGHWQFNPETVLGASFLGLPVEEWLFFIVIGFVSVFTLEAVRKKFPEGK